MECQTGVYPRASKLQVARARLRQRRVHAIADQTALYCCLALPLCLLHARAGAEILIAAIDLLFLLHTWLDKDSDWTRRPFTLAAGLWWIWLTLCSAIGTGGFLMGLVALRLPLLALALSEWLLARDGTPIPPRQVWLWRMLAASAAWIALESWQQYLTGSNMFGQPRFGDGALTGPFNKPRAGPGFILVFFPALVPAVMAMMNRRAILARLAGLLVAALAVLTMILIGQRMPTVLMLLGLALLALVLPRLRLVVAGAAIAGALLVAATPVISRPTYDKLVVQFTDQMRHFGQSDYGLIFVRAVNVAQLHPWIGLGFDGFRRGCHDMRAAHGIAWLAIPTVNFNGGTAACNLHPHNYYLEAADDAGLPGLALFTAMVATALVPLGTGLARRPDPLRVGLFVGALVALWPVSSTSSFTSMPNAGWVFLILGFGFAAGKQGLRSCKTGSKTLRL